MSQRLLIVGASARAAAVSGHRGGLGVATADLFADVDLVGIAGLQHSPRGLLSLAVAGARTTVAAAPVRRRTGLSGERGACGDRLGLPRS